MSVQMMVRLTFRARSVIHKNSPMNGSKLFVITRKTVTLQEVHDLNKVNGESYFLLNFENEICTNNPKFQ